MHLVGFIIKKLQQEQDGTRSILVLLKSCLQTCITYTIAECTVNVLLMVDRGTVRNMQSFMTKLICEISAAGWFYHKEICYCARLHERKIIFGVYICYIFIVLTSEFMYVMYLICYVWKFTFRLCVCHIFIVLYIKI